MAVVVSDTSPIRALSHLGRLVPASSQPRTQDLAAEQEHHQPFALRRVGLVSAKLAGRMAKGSPSRLEVLFGRSVSTTLT